MERGREREGGREREREGGREGGREKERKIEGESVGAWGAPNARVRTTRHHQGCFSNLHLARGLNEQHWLFRHQIKKEKGEREKRKNGGYLGGVEHFENVGHNLQLLILRLLAHDLENRRRGHK
jgi:hypothetical protein